MPVAEMSTTEEQTLLLNAAKKAAKNAYIPYSKFSVGAALLTEDGSIITGCNVENASYGATICAERCALVKAVSEGYQKFKAIAIVTAHEKPGSPCGICRQFMVEFGFYPVYLGSTTSDQVKITSVGELLPYAFTPKHIEEFENGTTEHSDVKPI
uniref:Cytidine deaminase n=1 Tax=Plectus sambesii TaxID=2011161 RepID=A0A914XM86_9BILA